MSQRMYSLIVPVYKNEETLPALLVEIDKLFSTLDGPFEAIFVIDGSPDNSTSLLQSLLPKQRYRSQLIVLARNFGSFSAIRVGLAAARGAYMAFMAADLQEPPELIKDMFQALRHEPVDLVFGQRIARDDPAKDKMMSKLFWWSYRKLVQKDVPAGGLDVFGCNSNVRDALLRMNETNTSLVGQLLWVGFRRKFIPYERLKRHSGKSAWSFRRKFRYMLDSIFAFTDLPLNLMLGLGIFGVIASMIVATIVLLGWMAGMITVSGYTPIMLFIAFTNSLTLLGLGILGAYLWRTYENTKQRPLSLTMIQEFHEPGSTP